MDSLANDLLLQIQDQQVKNAAILGRLESKLDITCASNAADKADFEVRIRSVEHRDWKHSGAIGVLLLLMEPALHWVGRRLGIV